MPEPISSRPVSRVRMPSGRKAPSGIMDTKHAESLVEQSLMLRFTDNQPTQALKRAREALSNLDTDSLLYPTAVLNLACHLIDMQEHREALEMINMLFQLPAFSTSLSLSSQIQARFLLAQTHFHLDQFQEALRHFRIALDYTPSDQTDIRAMLLFQVGLVLVKLDNYEDAKTNFEQSLATNPSHASAYHLLLCHFTLRVPSSLLESAFQNFITIEPEQLEQMDDELRRMLSNAAQIVIQSRPKCERLYAYDSILDRVSQSVLGSYAPIIEYSKALFLLKHGHLEESVDILSMLAKQDYDAYLKGCASEVLCMVAYHQNDIVQAEYYGSQSQSTHAYNNLANAYSIHKRYEEARRLYQQCETRTSKYNLALMEKNMGNFVSSSQRFKEIIQQIHGDAEVMFHIADLYEKNDDFKQAAEWYLRVLALHPSDAPILAKLGHVHDKLGDKNKARQFFTESYRNYGWDVRVLVWLGRYNFNDMKFDEAQWYFERASRVQPFEPSWQVQVVQCWRSMGQYQTALEQCRDIHKRFPRDLECLKLLIKLATDLALPEVRELKQKYAELERQQSASLKSSSRSPSQKTKSTDLKLEDSVSLLPD